MAENLSMKESHAFADYAKRDGGNITSVCLDDKPAVDIRVEAELYV